MEENCSEWVVCFGSDWCLGCCVGKDVVGFDL